ncbi:MAG: hypothetical protein ACE37H_15950 [Phycisphaeraceae bacterium]
MDDPTSRQQIDELADLYLTGVIEEADQADAAPDDNPLEGPEPIRLSPKTGNDTGVDPDAVNDNASALDDLARNAHQDPDDRHPVLRLTETDEDQQANASDTTAQSASMDNPNPVPDANEPAPQAMLEAVLLGNLPGMSGPWLTQYAQLIAQSDGPVALLHVGEEAIDLELIEPRAEAEPAPAGPTAAVRIPPMRGNKTGLVGLIDALTRSETAPTRTVLVRLDSADDAQTLSRFAAIQNWTLLCGADDASVAGASRQLRTMVRADPRLADRGVGVMVMGSDEPSARGASQRIADEVNGDLVHRVEFIGHLKRMQPVQVRELGSFPDPVAVWPQLVAWFDTLEPPAFEPEPEPVLETVVPEPAFKPAPQTAKNPTPKPTATAASSPAPAIARQATKAPRLSDAAAKIGTPTPQQPVASRPAPRPVFTATPPKPKPAPTPQPQAATHSQPERPTARQPETQAPRPAPLPAPTPTASTERPAAGAPTRPAPQPRVLARQAELDLIALVAQGPAALQDPAALDARIPDQPDTQLAVDAQGVVHILMKMGTVPIHGGDTASTDARQAVMHLIEAGRWVREHLELLALTQRDREFIDADPVLHLLTDRADLTTQLVGKLAGQVKLHLLQQVKLGRETGWFCTPLG